MKSIFLLLFAICTCSNTMAFGQSEDSCIIIIGQIAYYGSAPYGQWHIRAMEMSNEGSAKIYPLDQVDRDILRTLDTYVYEFVLKPTDMFDSYGNVVYKLISYTRIE